MKQLDRDNNILKAFFTLIRAGLWEEKVDISDFGEIDFGSINTLAEEQSVVGLLTAGIENINDVKVPKELTLLFVGQTIQIEQQNRAINEFIAKLIQKLRHADIYTLLIKGQGIAQCYERPLWRASGDVDLLLSDVNYRKAIPVITNIAGSVEEENMYNRHIAMTVEDWMVELHGTLRSGLWKTLDSELDKVQKALFYDGKVRSWMDENTQIFLPHQDEDVLYVFSHILQHFYQEGVGLRQICDWCRLLWTYKNSLNKKLLETRLCDAGIMTEWKAFGALAVEYLGMPEEAIPFYSSNRRWSRKAKKIIGFILETGNFGHNRDYSYQDKYPYIVYKTISLWKHLKDGAFFFSIFPLDSIKVTWRRMIVGFSVAIKGKRHE